MKKSIFATFGGREYIFKKKMICAVILSAFVWLLASCIEFLGIIYRYSLSDFNAPIKSLSFMNNIPFNCSIGMFLIFLYLIRLLLLLSVSFAVCYISSKMKFELAMTVCAFVLVIPSLLYCFGVKAVEYFAVVIPISAMRLIIDAEYGLFILSVILILFLGVGLFTLARQSWCKKGMLINGIKN